MKYSGDTAVKKARLKRFFLCHSAVAAVFLLIIFVYKCPLSYFFHIPCPGCGVTRAYFALLSLDIKKAFEYHPLFWVVAPLILYIAHRNSLKKRLSAKTETVIFFAVCAAFLAVYLIRLTTGGLRVLV